MSGAVDWGARALRVSQTKVKGLGASSCSNEFCVRDVEEAWQMPGISVPEDALRARRCLADAWHLRARRTRSDAILFC